MGHFGKFGTIYDFSVQNDAFPVRNDDFSVRNDDFLLRNDDLSVQNDDWQFLAILVILADAGKLRCFEDFCHFAYFRSNLEAISHAHGAVLQNLLVLSILAISSIFGPF